MKLRIYEEGVGPEYEITDLVVACRLGAKANRAAADLMVPSVADPRELLAKAEVCAERLEFLANYLERWEAVDDSLNGGVVVADEPEHFQEDVPFEEEDQEEFDFESGGGI